jgi:3-dehydroquinate dehydratase / shikimate dehydrogenase
MTRLCVPIFCRDSEQIRRDVARAIEAGADLIELRLDTYDDIDDTLLLFTQSDAKFILTRRPERQGGESEEDDESRYDMLFSHRSGNRNALVDLEFDGRRTMEYNEMLNEAAIVSNHDFKSRPATLSRMFVEMAQTDAGVVKIAWQARSIRDCIEAFQLLDLRPKPAIVICMGEAGMISRILCKKFGAYLTFASLTDTSATAPGQVTIDKLKSLYRWDAIKSSTKVYGVVGSPVAHSMSPAIHNAGFASIDFDGVYVPLLVEPGWESFKAFMESFLAFPRLGLSGLSITIPHKENALRYATEKGWHVDPLAQQIGAVNTYDLREGNCRAFSTDYGAILDTITTALGIAREDLQSKRVCVLGAGGTGRTAVAALAQYGATVGIANRTRARAEELAAEFHGKVGDVFAMDFEDLPSEPFDIYLNCTSVGMSPKVDASVFDAHAPKLDSSKLVFDTVYNPMETKLLKIAKASGAKTAGGIEMFIRQAAGQFEAWTQAAAPLELMRKVVVERLSAPGR